MFLSGAARPLPQRGEPRRALPARRADMPSALTASIPNLRSLTKLRFRSGQISKKRPERGVRDVFIPSLLLGVHGAHLAILAHALELDLAVDQREQGIVLADADVVARMDMRASLANENVAGEHELPVCALGADILMVISLPVRLLQ